MSHARYFGFDPFWLDALDERLWENETAVRLGRKAFAILKRLVSQPGQLVTKDDLLSTAWPDTAVSEAVLTTAMREIRRALRDQARLPHYVETVHGRGYRFIAPVSENIVPQSATELTTETIDRRLPGARMATTGSLVGRAAELARLHEWYAAVEQGDRRLVVVAGEAGIGKTALVEKFVSEVSVERKVQVCRGQCIPQYGHGEAYLPILEAIGRLARYGGLPVVNVLREHAPSWVPHLSSITPDTEFTRPTSPTPEKMLRELADTLEILTARSELIMVLEDLQWSDNATLELLAYITRRRGPAQLLIIGTYRPLEESMTTHRLGNLVAGHCSEIVLDCLSREAVQNYIVSRWNCVRGLEKLGEELHRLTGGHPLFLTTIVDELRQQQSAEGSVDSGCEAPDPKTISIPPSLRQFIENHFEQLSVEERSILEAAGVAGNSFPIAAVVAGTSLSSGVIDACCARWAREGQFLVTDGSTIWPDGTMSARYSFRHALFQEIVYARIAPDRRAGFHLRIGIRLEGAYRRTATSIAAELATHFEQGRDVRRAFSYLTQAARNALKRSAYVEAERHLTHGLDILGSCSEDKRLRQELELLLLLGPTLMTSKGWGVDRVEHVYCRALELSEHFDDVPHTLQALWGLIAVSVVRAELRKTRGLARKMLALSKTQQNPVFRLAAHMELGGTNFALGKAVSAQRHFRAAHSLYRPDQQPSYIARFGVDLGLFSQIWETHALWIWGYPDQARTKAEEVMTRAHDTSHIFTQTVTLAYATMLNQFRRDIGEVDRLSKATITHSTAHGFPYYQAWGEVLSGWSTAMQGAADEGIGKIHRGIEALQTMGSMRLPYYRALLAEAYGFSGQVEEALEAIDKGLMDVRKVDECWWEAELHRLRGELLQLPPINQRGKAETCFGTAMSIARRQRSKSLELRAAVSLARLWSAEGKRNQAREMLVEAYDWFSEGFETAELKVAKSLLTTLAS